MCSDFSDERAGVVRRLNAAGVPVAGIPLLPLAEGYYFTADNADRAAGCYQQWVAWSRRHGLAWDGVGLDVEPDARIYLQIMDGPWGMVPMLAPRLFDRARPARARAAYQELVERIRADGWRVENYQFPLIADERRAGSTLLQRLALVDVATDREVWMLYSSFMRALGPGLIWAYGPEAAAIGVGTTGGGPDIPGSPQMPSLSWEELAGDLCLARHFCDQILIHSLEGASGRASWVGSGPLNGPMSKGHRTAHGPPRPCAVVCGQPCGRAHIPGRWASQPPRPGSSGAGDPNDVPAAEMERYLIGGGLEGPGPTRQAAVSSHPELHRDKDTHNSSIWAVRARRCPALAAARNRRFCGDIRSCPAAAHLQGGRIARSRRGGRGRTGYLGPCRPGPTPAEPPHGSANVKIAQGKGTRRETEGEPEPGQRPKGTNRRTPDEGKPEEGGRRGGTRRANGKPEESPRGETGGREVRPQTTR